MFHVTYYLFKVNWILNDIFFKKLWCDVVLLASGKYVSCAQKMSL